MEFENKYKFCIFSVAMYQDWYEHMHSQGFRIRSFEFLISTDDLTSD